MSEQPATIAHEAKGIHQSLKEILNAKGPLDREVDFQRKRLRKQYLSLLLEYPYAKESKDAEMHLWMQTSYAFISAYKQRLLSLDKAMQNKANHAQQQQGQDNTNNNNTNPAPNGRNNNNSHVVEHRKFLQRFKQFLADEEKFWKQLVVRFWRSFGLHEAKQALIALELITEEAGAQEDGGNDHQQGGGHGRNHFQFPQESGTVFVPRTAEERESWISMITKSLICLGDIARYRAFYSDPGRPRPGQDEGRRGRNRRGGGHVAEAIPRPKNYEKAQAYYKQAAALSPTDGNAYHQLAILATYRKDPFESVMYHYRALCVRSPYDPALDNMNGILSKALDQWKRSRHEGRDLAPGQQTEAFKERILALNGLWKIGLEKGVDKMDALTRRRNTDISNDFAGLVSRRFINQQGIQHTLIIAQGALWKHRMLRPTNSSNRGDKPPPPPGTSVVIEWRILEHLMNVHRALLEVGSEELKTDISTDDLGQSITAPFRRTLHSLRIASKWLRANLAYLMQDHEFDSYQAHKANSGVEVHRNKDFRLSRFSTVTKQFWAAYCEFMSSLSVKFPADRLPAITVQFDEDTEMRGFLPLRNQIGEVRESTEDGVNSHPNDWELMRIADLLKDGQELVTAPNSPIFESYGIYNIRQGIFEPRHPNAQIAEPGGPAQPQQEITSAPRPVSRPEVEDDGNMTDSTSDILGEIDRFVHNPDGEEDDEMDDDEEIVWNPRASLSPQMNSNLPSPPQLTPVVNTVPLRSPPTSVHQLSPTHSQTLSPFSKPIHPPGPAPTTAQDLLNHVLSGRTGTRTKMEPPAAAAPALFSDLNHASGGHNIWSAAQDEQSLKFSSQPNQTYQHRQPQSISTSMGLSPSSAWSSSYPVSTQDSHRDLPGSLPPPIYGQQSPNFRAGNHQRIPSNGLGLGLGSQTLSPPRYGAGLPDTLVYSSTSPPRVPARPELYGLGSTSPLMGQSMASINTLPNGLYSNSPLLNYNGNHPINTSHAFASPPMSNAHPHMWSNVG